MKNIYLLMPVLVLATDILAYETTTHGKLAVISVEGSILSMPDGPLLELGLPSLVSDDEIYVDSNGVARKLSEMFRFGAVYEDDISSLKFLRHFYDPQTGRGLRYIFEYENSPNWILERDEEDVVLENEDQSFSYLDARRYLYDALTCSSYACRIEGYSAMFQSLGHVLHHIQDMGQPQHARLDPHGSKPNNFYEQYTQRREYFLDSIIQNNPYVQPRADTHYFDHPRKYWETGDGRGMAEFSGTNFTSLGTNYTVDDESASGFSGAPGLPLPDGSGLVRVKKDYTLYGVQAEKHDGAIEYLEGEIHDPFSGITEPGHHFSTEEGLKMAAISIFEPYVRNLPPLERIVSPVTLDTTVFDDRHRILLPRIVAFGTDFINYFFRGRLDFLPDPSAHNSWRIYNKSNDEMSGLFELYSDDRYGNRAHIASWELDLQPGSTSTPLSFTKPAAATDNYALVFKGRMGRELDAVAGRVLNLNTCTAYCNDCGPPLAPSGGQSNSVQKYDYVVSSDYAQTIDGYFEAYTIPDRLKVFGGGNLLYDTDEHVSGVHDFSFAYDPSVHGATLKVHVDAPFNGTAWNFRLGCNSHAGTGGAYTTPVPIHINIEGSGSGCSATAEIRGRTNRNIRQTYYGGGHSTSTSLLPGDYSIHLKNFSAACQAGTSSNWIGMTLSRGGSTLSNVNFFNTTGTFSIPAIPGLE